MSTLDPPTITIRSASPADYEVCQTLDHSCSTDYVWQVAMDTQAGALEVQFRPARLPRSMKVIYPRGGEALLQSWREHACFLVAMWDNGVVGYINMRVEDAQETAWVADMAVEPSHRMSGVGTLLLRGARQWAMDQNLRRFIVETQTKNYPSIQFLQKRGLIFCGYNDLYYPNQDIAVFFGQSLR